MRHQRKNLQNKYINYQELTDKNEKLTNLYITNQITKRIKAIKLNKLPENRQTRTKSQQYMINMKS